MAKDIRHRLLEYSEEYKTDPLLDGRDFFVYDCETMDACSLLKLS